MIIYLMKHTVAWHATEKSRGTLKKSVWFTGKGKVFSKVTIYANFVKIQPFQFQIWLAVT